MMSFQDPSTRCLSPSCCFGQGKFETRRLAIDAQDRRGAVAVGPDVLRRVPVERCVTQHHRGRRFVVADRGRGEEPWRRRDIGLGGPRDPRGGPHCKQKGRARVVAAQPEQGVGIASGIWRLGVVPKLGQGGESLPAAELVGLFKEGTRLWGGDG